MLTETTVTVSSNIGNSAVAVIPADPTVISIGTVGPQGPPGPPGPPAAALQAIAGANITQIGTVLVLQNDGTLIPADPTNATHATLLLGINLTTGIAGSSIEYITVGQITGLSGLLPGSLYFVGPNGTLSTNSQSSGATWLRALGNASSTTIFILDKQTPILLT